MKLAALTPVKILTEELQTETPPPVGQVWKNYFLVRGQRVAMREYTATSSEVYFIIGDHLGSTNIVTDVNGTVVSKLRYSAYGEERYTENTTPTNYRYTGQLSKMTTIGLYFYKARWFDPTIAHFTSADTIVPGTGNPMAWDRYAYVLWNPTNFNDPSGHVCSDPEDPTPSCENKDPRDQPVNKGSGGGKQTNPPPPQPPVNPLGRELTDDEINVMVVVMRYEIRGYTALKDWKLIKMKFWVFLNLVNSRLESGTFGWNIYSKQGEPIGVWNVYVSYMGHESLIKPILAQNVDNWTPDNYFGQEAALLEHALLLAEIDSDFAGLRRAAKEVADIWYQFGSDSALDPTGGATSFWDTGIRPADSIDTIVYGPWQFDTASYYYSGFK